MGILTDELWETVKTGDTISFLALLAQGANIEEKDINGATPLMVASELGHTQFVIALLGQGADIEAKDSGGRNALFFASWFDCLEVIQVLLSHGAAIDANPKGWTALMATAYFGNLDGAKVFLEDGANQDIKNNDGKTALMLAQEKSKTEVVALLQSTIEKQQLLTSIIAPEKNEHNQSGFHF